MFKTADGHTLELAPWRMRRFMRLVAEARRTPPGMTSRTITQDMQILLRRARRVAADPQRKIARFESSGACCRACFLARKKRDAMEVVALSVAPGAHLYEDELDELEMELEVERSANVALTWKHYKTLAGAAANTSGIGVYILMRGSRPIYVGKSMDLGERLGKHRLYARQHDSGLNVWIANTPLASDAAAVEHVLVRALRTRVTNRKLKVALIVGKNGLRIDNVLPPGIASPKAPGKLVDLAAGRTFELAP
ncbi:hypothetical protein AWB74_04109 [Caballeronia arvi]|uniref:GIY-YIG domain-containing protein n=1 Tax=Caballeronia arvi TaxID=1777135 RepID=A0A158JN86_9BURK|nr:GIY-YIG nuclease family protein [Caballeronia arvi]SAL70238.1 hypothetical protein AWB74_04109 [Caballeronia arvi]